MGKDINIKISKKNNKKVGLIFSELLVLFLIVISSASAADSGYSVQNKSSDVENSVINQISSSTEPALAPVNPEFIAYQNNKQLLSTAFDGHVTGHRPRPLEINNMNKISTPKTSTNLPAYYDLRTTNKLTSVKDQGQEGPVGRLLLKELLNRI